MTSTLKNFELSSSLKDEAMVTKMQGIVSILGTDSDTLKISSNSLRRTLSADMSSRKWLSQHGFSPLKKVVSSDNFCVSIAEYSSSSSSSSSLFDGEEEDYDHDHCSNKNENNKPQFEIENQSQFDIWSSIIQQKKLEDSNNVPYVHPLVRRSSSSLSEKSLQICTESLGSETGSDVFSSYTPSETSDAEEDKEEQPQQQQQKQEVLNINDYDVEEMKYKNLAAATKKATPKSFPPPISSLSSHRDGASVLMKSHRDNGRLVLEAVSVSSQNNFRAERQDGRLVLTLIDGVKQEQEEVVAKKGNEVDQFEVELECPEEETEHEDEEEEEEEEMKHRRGGEMKFVMEQAPKLNCGIINVHRLATMVDKTSMLNNTNPTSWTTNQAKFDEGLVMMMEEVVKPSVGMTQSLPPRPPIARAIPSAQKMTASATIAKSGAVSFNPYEYYWKPKPISPATVPNTCKTMLVTQNSRNNLNKMLYIVQNCKEQRRSLVCQ